MKCKAGAYAGPDAVKLVKWTSTGEWDSETAPATQVAQITGIGSTTLKDHRGGRCSCHNKVETQPRELKILIIDIERLPGWVELQKSGINLSGPFWDLSGWKWLIKHRLSPDVVTRWPRTICAAWRFLGDSGTEFASEWGDGPEGLMRRTWEAYDAADIVVGHNLARFDTKHLNTGWRDSGFMPPSPYKTIDTLQVARRHFGDESKTLDALTRRIGLSGKTDKYDPAVALAACEGDVEAQTRIQGYNVGDIDATEALYLRLLPWINAHPHVTPDAGNARAACPRCGSRNVTRNGSWSPGVYRYAVYRCTDCGGNYRTTYETRGPSVRAL